MQAAPGSGYFQGMEFLGDFRGGGESLREKRCWVDPATPRSEAVGPGGSRILRAVLLVELVRGLGWGQHRGETQNEFQRGTS